ncbi:unnamed protein product [Lactuca saligna]|uniref:Uncharacterized protein n=1 Tax=Lactuca saligna TaxID=75948 RepID=A0AA36E6C7_LACSI|nr:unnamed protein product [Lactuca saligna]
MFTSKVHQAEIYLLIPPTPEVRLHESVSTPHHYPSHTTMPISIAPPPPTVTSQPTSTPPIASTVPLPPPIITQATPQPLRPNLRLLLMYLIWGHLPKHDDSIQQATKAVDSSSLSCKNASINVAKIIEDSQMFLDSLTGVAKSNANKANSVVDSLSKSLQDEHQKIEMVRDSLKADQTAFLPSISCRLDKLQNELAMENKVMDELALKTTQVKTQALQLTQVQKEIDYLKS